MYHTLITPLSVMATLPLEEQGEKRQKKVGVSSPTFTAV